MQAPNGEPAQERQPLDTGTNVERSLERFAIHEAVIEEIENSVTRLDVPESGTEQSPGASLDPMLAHVQNIRRVQEFANDGRSEDRVREWDGAEHEGVVVAADSRGVVMHVGRSEYMRIPTRSQSLDREIIGSHVAVDRSGTLSGQEVAARERSQSSSGHGGR